MEPAPPCGRQRAAPILGDTEAVRVRMTHQKHQRAAPAGRTGELSEPHTPPTQHSPGERDNKNHPPKPPPTTGLGWGLHGSGTIGRYPKCRGALKHLWALIAESRESRKGRSQRGLSQHLAPPPLPQPPAPHRGLREEPLQAPRSRLGSEAVCRARQGIGMLCSPSRRTFFPDGSLERERVDTSLRMQDLARRDHSA